ncbi:MAG: hypothetical protein ACOCQE_01370 [Halanaerobium sp.]
MRNILIVIIIIMAVLLAGALTNPSREEFINWGIEEIRSESESDFERIFGGAFAGPILEMQTEAKDYVFFSIFTVKKSDNELKYIGIFNNFISLK